MISENAQKYQNRTSWYDSGTVGTISVRKIVPKKNYVTRCSSVNMVQRTFPYAVVGDWNALPVGIFDGAPQMDNLPGFKVAVHHHLLAA